MKGITIKTNAKAYNNFKKFSSEIKKRSKPLPWIIFATFVILVLFFTHIINLQHAPPNVTGDEVTSLNDVIRITYFPQNVRFFSLMGDGSQAAINFYYISFITRPFFNLNAILGMRLSSVFLSLGVLIAFYFYLTTKVNKFSSLAATFLLGMNTTFLNFSRASWMSNGQGLGLIEGLFSFIFLEYSVAKARWIWTIPAGLLIGLTFYGYMGNVIFPFSCFVYLSYLALRHRLKWKIVFLQMSLLLLSAFIIFLPQFIFNLHHFDQYTLRSRSTSILSVSKPYYGQTSMLSIVGHQLEYTVSGFLILNPAVVGEGSENQRYVSPQGSVDIITRLLFILGLGTAIFLVRKAILLPSMAFFGAIILNFLSQFPPNFARGLFALLFIYIIIAILIEKIWLLKILDVYGRLTLVLLIVSLGLWNGWYYFQWQGSSQLAQARQPAIQYEQVPCWVKLSKEHSALNQSDLVITSEEWNQLTGITCIREDDEKLPNK